MKQANVDAVDDVDQVQEEPNAHGIRIFNPHKERERDIRLKRRVRYIPHLHEDSASHEMWYRKVITQKKRGLYKLGRLKSADWSGPSDGPSDNPTDPRGANIVRSKSLAII